MNGPRIGATLSNAFPGYGMVWHVEMPGVSCSVRVLFGGTLRCTLNGESVDVSGGSGSVVDLRFDQDRPVGGWGPAVDVHVDGTFAATLPASPPAENLCGAAPWLAGCCFRARFRVYHAIDQTSNDSVSNVTVGGWDNDYSDVAWDGTGTSPWFAVRPPVGGNLVRLPSGQQFLARATQSGANPGSEVTVFERPGPGGAWAVNLAGSAGGSGMQFSGFGELGVLSYSNPVMYSRQHYLVVYGVGPSPDVDPLATPFQIWGSLNFGQSWDAAVDTVTAPEWDALRLPIEDVWWAPQGFQFVSCPFTMMRAYEDGVHFGCFWPTGLGDEHLCCFHAPYSGSGYFERIADLSDRSGRNTPWPFFHRLPDGRFHVGCFVDGDYRAWESTDTTGTTWAEAEDQAVSDPFTLFASCAFWKSASGREAVVGHATDPDGVEDEGFRLFTRAGTGQQWEGPYLNVLSTTSAHPYLYERTDGTWEVGWRLGDTWHRYEADTPASELADWSSL